MFDAQEALEKRHRVEEDELYEQMVEERRQQMLQLEQSLVAEREHTVSELIAWFENQGITKQERDAGLKKVSFVWLSATCHSCSHYCTIVIIEQKNNSTEQIINYVVQMMVCCVVGPTVHAFTFINYRFVLFHKFFYTIYLLRCVNI